MSAKGLPNVMKLHEIYEDKNNKYLVMDFYGKNDGNLEKIFGTKKTFSEDQVRIMVKQILSGLSGLHNEGYIHRDLKLENIMYEEKDRKKKADICKITIIDLGFAIQADKNTEKTNPITPRCVTGLKKGESGVSHSDETLLLTSFSEL